MGHLYGFGYALENERLDGPALGLPGGRVLAIASGGEAPLGLLAAGADEVVAVDVSQAQLHLLHLKLAAVIALARPDAIAFLGYRPTDSGRRLEHYRSVRGALPPDSREFWDDNARAIGAGAIHRARFGTYVRRVVGLIETFLRVGPAIRELFECRSLQRQEEVCRRHFDRGGMRAAFRLGFHPRLLSTLGLDPRSLAHRDPDASFGEYCYRVVRRAFTDTPIRENHVMQLLLLGRVVGNDAVPAFLSAEGFPRVRNGADRLRTERIDLRSFLEGDLDPGRFSGFHLSNVADWTGPEAWAELLRGLLSCATTDARLVTRHIHARPTLPPDLNERIRPDEELGMLLSQQEMFPIWEVVPARIEGSGAT